MVFDFDDLENLAKAKYLLENPGFAARFTNLFGLPIERGFEMLPQNWKDKVGKITYSALSRALSTVSFTLNDAPYRSSSNFWHKIAVGTTGGISGFFGLGALVVELPVSTIIMLRSIADIARSEGESIGSPDTQIACMEVFAFGGGKNPNGAYESTYFMTRAALASYIANTTEYIAKKGLVDGCPPLVRLLFQISERFSVQVSEKAVSQALPAIGAAGGILINTLFIKHFQDIARGHFIVRRLEKKYGTQIVQNEYAILEPNKICGEIDDDHL